MENFKINCDFCKNSHSLTFHNIFHDANKCSKIHFFVFSFPFISSIFFPLSFVSSYEESSNQAKTRS